MFKKVMIGIAAVALFAAGFLTSQFIHSAATPSVTLSATTVQQQLSESSDLATAKLEYRGLVTYEEGDVPFINQKKFTMIYDSEVRAGVDLSQADVSVEGQSVVVTLPQAALQTVSVDPNSIEFYDEAFALFNWQNRMDTAEALKLAEDDAEGKVNNLNMIEEANKQAQLVVENLLMPFTEGENAYDVRVVQS